MCRHCLVARGAHGWCDPLTGKTLLKPKIIKKQRRCSQRRRSLNRAAKWTDLNILKGRVWAAQPTPLKASFSAPPPIPWLTGDMFFWKWLCRLWYDFPLVVKIAFRTWLSTLGILKHTDSLGSWWSHGTKFLTFRIQSHIGRSTSLITWTIGYVT